MDARVNVTFAGNNGDLPDLVNFDSTDGDLKQMVTEAIRGGGVPGIPATANVDLTDFVVDRFDATGGDRLIPALFVRPKTPFGSC